MLFYRYSFSYSICVISRDLLYNIVSIVNNIGSCPSKFLKRADAMVSVLTIPVHIFKKQGNIRILRGVGYVCYLDCDDGIMDVCIGPNSSNFVH